MPFDKLNKGVIIKSSCCCYFIFQSLVKVEYFYRNQTDDFDLTKAVVKFNKNAVVKNPDCLKQIKLEIKQLPP